MHVQHTSYSLHTLWKIYVCHLVTDRRLISCWCTVFVYRFFLTFLSQANTARFESAGLTVASVEPVTQSTDELPLGAIVGIVVGALVIVLIVLLVVLTVMFFCWMR